MNSQINVSICGTDVEREQFDVPILISRRQACVTHAAVTYVCFTAYVERNTGAGIVVAVLGCRKLGASTFNSVTEHHNSRMRLLAYATRVANAKEVPPPVHRGAK